MFVGGQLYSALGGPGMYLVVGITAGVIFILHLISVRLFPPPSEGLYSNDSILLHFYLFVKGWWNLHFSLTAANGFSD